MVRIALNTYFDGDRDRAEQLLSMMLSEHAYELAEEVRREGGHKLCPYGCALLDAALIDPEVQNDGP
ncbi:hypothetical protein [Streptomyces tsukubensis]|uniref:hypothetical protein n=1 Tax=Streptomyces tsukubensis TaxID=83656 RepID=UPI00344C1B5D